MVRLGVLFLVGALSLDVCCTALDAVVEVTLQSPGTVVACRKFDIFDCRHLEYRHTVLLDTEVLGPAIVTSAKALRAFPSQLANSRFTLYIQIVHHIKFIFNDESVLYLSLYYTYTYCLKLNDE